MGCQENAAWSVGAVRVQNYKVVRDENTPRKGDVWKCLLFSNEEMKEWEEWLEQIASSMARREAAHSEGEGFGIRPTYVRNYRQAHSAPQTLFPHA